MYNLELITFLFVFAINCVGRSRSAAGKDYRVVSFYNHSIPGAYNYKGVCHDSKRKETKRFNELYERHQNLMKLHGMAAKTIEAYARGVLRVMMYFDCVPDQLTVDQLEDYFVELVNKYSWSTVRCDRLGLMFFWKHVLKRDWQWFTIIKPPKVKTIPNVLTTAEVEQPIINARELRYRVFILATYSMGLRLTEALSLQVGDIDSGYKRVHVRRGTGAYNTRI